jgi:hypothetical protein
MKKPVLIVAILALAFGSVLGLTFVASAQEKAAPNAPELVRKALGNAGRSLDLLDKYSYTKHQVTESYDLKGKLLRRDEWTVAFTPCEGKTCTTLLSHNGAPPSAKELKEHDKEMRKAWEKQAKQTPEDKRKEEDDDVMLSQDFLEIFTFVLSGRESYKEQPAYIIEFTPKAEKAELKAHESKVLARMAGRLWISEKEEKVLAVEMHMIKPIKVWGGIAGAIDTMKVLSDYVVSEAGEYLPRRVDTEMDVRLGFTSKVRLKISEEYTDFKLAVSAMQRGDAGQTRARLLLLL